jgi:hypothetical protein
MSSARISTTNSTVTNLSANQSFFGTKDTVGEFTKCGVSVFADQEIYLLVTQSQNGVSADKLDVYTIPASTAPPPFTEFASPRISVEMSHKYVTITARNTSATTATTFCRIETQVYNEGFLTHTHDSVKLFGTTADGTHKAVLTDATGALIVSGGGGGDASRWADFPAVDNVDMDGFALQKVTGINSTALDNLSISTAGGDIQLQTATDQLTANVMSYSVLGNLTLSNGGQNINNVLGVTTSKEFTLTQNGGGVITFEDGTTQSTAGGGGGNFSTPSNQDLDMNSHKIIGITQLGGVGDYSNPIIVNNNIQFAGDAEFGSGSRILNVDYISGANSGGMSISDVLTIQGADGQLLLNANTVLLTNDLKFNDDGTIQTTAYQNPFAVSLDMNDNGITNVNSINGVATKGLPITTDGIISLASQASVQLQIPPAPPTGLPPYPEPPPTKVLSYDGDLTFAEGTQNISNSLGTTTSNSFTLTQDGGGKITFADLTEMTTASASPSTWSDFPATGTVDMGGFGLSNINNDIVTGVNGSLSILSNNNDPVATATLRLIINEALIENTKPASEIKLEGGQVLISTVGEGGWDGSPIKTTTFGSDGKLSVPSLQLMSGTLDLNGQSVVRTQQIFGDNDMIFTAGMTDTSESSTLRLTNNGYEVAGAYSQLFLNPTGAELNTGNITAETNYTAKFDTNGILTVPQLAIAVTEGGGALNMNGGRITNAVNIIGATDSGVYISSDIGVDLISDVNGTPKYASLDTNGVFNAKSFTLYQDGGGEIKFPDGSTQTTAYTTALQSITSTDGSITIDYPDTFTANLAVTSPYTLPVATTTVLGGVKPDGTTITATVDGVISATSQGITSNTFYVNDNVNSINDVLPLMGSGDICIVSAGSFGNTVDINWNVAQTGLSGSVAPLPLTFLTTANASRFTVSATQVRVANIKFQMPVFLSANNCTIDNADFDDNLTVGTGVSGYITINNCEFVGTKTITVASTFTNVCYFVNCNFLGSTFSLLQASSASVVFNNCAGFVSFPTNATYVGINVLTNGSTQLSTVTIKSVASGGNVTYASQINMDGNNIINVNNISGRTGDPPSFTQSFEVATGAGNIQMRGNGIVTCGTITQLLQGSTLVSLTPSQALSRNNWTVSIPFFAGGGSASFAMNDLGVFSTKSVTLTTGGQITYPDTTTQNSGLIKGTVTLVGGTVTIPDARITTGAICVVSYADSPPVNGVLCAKVSTGQIIIESTLLADDSPVFYMYFV